jgi:hypothetical protein
MPHSLLNAEWILINVLNKVTLSYVSVVSMWCFYQVQNTRRLTSGRSNCKCTGQIDGPSLHWFSFSSAHTKTPMSWGRAAAFWEHTPLSDLWHTQTTSIVNKDTWHLLSSTKHRRAVLVEPARHFPSLDKRFPIEPSNSLSLKNKLSSFITPCVNFNIANLYYKPGCHFYFTSWCWNIRSRGSQACRRQMELRTHVKGKKSQATGRIDFAAASITPVRCYIISVSQ